MNTGTNNLPAAILQPDDDLETLAAAVRTAHYGVTLAAANLIEYALAAGDALIAAKKEVKRGYWLKWLKKECDLSSRQAERYMVIAAGRATIMANSTHVSNLSLRGALQLLPRSPRQTRKRPAGTQIADLHRQIRDLEAEVERQKAIIHRLTRQLGTRSGGVFGVTTDDGLDIPPFLRRSPPPAAESCVLAGTLTATGTVSAVPVES